MKALEFYKALLASAGVSEQSGGMGLMLLDDKAPVTVGGKLLVLPTDEVLAQYNEQPDKLQVFHPVCENILRKDSPVFNFLKRLYRTSLSMDLELIITNLITFALNHELSSKANKKQRAVLSGLDELDDKTMTNISGLLDKVDANGKNKMIDIIVHRGHEIDGVKYQRVAYVLSPLYHELLEGNDKPFGAKLRKKDIKMLKYIFEYIFGKLVEDPDVVLRVGTNSSTAPNFVALTQSYVDIKNRMLNLYDIFGTKFTPLTGHDTSWSEQLGDLAVYRNTLPSFEGNDGEPLDEDKQDEPMRKPIPQREKVRVTPLGTVRKIQDKIEEDSGKEPISYAEMISRGRQNTDEVVQSRYRSDDRDTRRRYRDTDLSDVDENLRREREERYREEDDRYSRYESRYARSYERREDDYRYGNGGNNRYVASARRYR